MTTQLEKELKRELAVRDQAYTLTISPDGLRLVPKGKRNGVELHWADLVSGEAALAVALNASLSRIGAFPEYTATSPRDELPTRRRRPAQSASRTPHASRAVRKAARSRK